MADYMRKKKMKKRGRSNLFRSCFRSFAVDERSFLKDKSDSPNIENGRLGKPGLLAVSGREGDDVIPEMNSVNGNGNGVDCVSERSSHGRTVSRLLKAVLFYPVMAKKTCSSSKSSIAYNTSDSFPSIEKTIKPSDDDGSNVCINESTDTEDSSSRCSNLLSSSSRATSSSYSSSSSSSSTNSNSRWLFEQKTSSSSPIHTEVSNNPISQFQKPNLINSTSTSSSISLPNSNLFLKSSSYSKQLSELDSVESKNTVSFNVNIRWCLFLLLSLIVLVVYGRIYAILCTSFWFYLMPCKRVKRVNSVSDSARVMDVTESEQYKKRVIMAGLLDRTRNPLR